MKEQDVTHVPQERPNAATNAILFTPTPADNALEQKVRREQELEPGMWEKQVGLPLNVEVSTGGTG